MTHMLKQRYLVIGKLGQGGMGEVHKAKDTHLGNRLIAVKEMILQDKDPLHILAASMAFKQEADILAGLQHPHLPSVHEHFEEAGHWYLVMEFIEGETLEEYRKIRGGKLPVEEVLDIGIQLCTVLDYLHTRQPPIIFRDLKPLNIMRTLDGHLYLIDFGIARHFKLGQAGDTAIAYSKGYAAPEQYGEAQTTARSDIYSLGATLHHLLSGNYPALTPFRFAPLKPQKQERLVKLNTLIMRMVEMDADKRPSSMAVKQELQRIVIQSPGNRPPIQPVLGSSISQKPVSLPQPGTPKQPSAKRVISRREVITVLAGLGLAIAGGGSIWWAAEHEMPSQRTLAIYRGHSQRVTDVQWSPDGKYIASGSYDNTVQVFDAANNLTTQLNGIKSGEAWDAVLSVAWSPDGTKIASTSTAGIVQVWEASTGKHLFNYDDNNNDVVNFVAWSPNGKYIASGDSDVQLWAVATGKLKIKFNAVFGGVNSVSWSPDGSKIAFGGGEAGQGDEVQIWDINTGKLTAKYTGHSDQVSCISWSPTGNNIASSSYDNTVQVWVAATGKLITMYTGHSDTVNSVAWSPDGTKIASGSGDDTVQVWVAATGNLVIDYSVHTGLTGFLSFAHFITKGVNSVAWSPDGTKIASGLEDNTVQVWRVQ